MKRLLSLLIVGALLAMVTGCPPSPTSEPPPPRKTTTDKTPPIPQTPTPPQPTEKTTSGKVTKIDADTKTVTVKDASDKDTTFTTDKDTKVTIEGADKGFADLKEGMNVDVTAKDAAASKIVAKAAAPPPPAETTTTTGKISKIDKEKKTITLKDDAGKETAVPVAAETKITVDGAADKKIDDLKEGQTVVVKAKGDSVASIEAKATTPPPAETPKPIMGKVVKAEAGKITLSVDGKDKEFPAPATAKVTIDAADKKPDDLKDLKPDDKTTATITSDKDGKVTAVDVKTK
jgi:hypothetical protein